MIDIIYNSKFIDQKSFTKYDIKQDKKKGGSL